MITKLSKILRFTLLAGAALYVVTYLILVFFRLQYPFELEWVEGSMVDCVRRVVSGRKLYVSPSLNFVPSIYNPFYFYCSAIVAKIVGVGFLPLRLMSFISSLGCLFMIFSIVRRETGNTDSAILASCLFAATYRISGAFFDIARVDSLFLFLLLAGVYVIRFYESQRSYMIAGLVISLSFLTKQTALLVAIPIVLYCIFANWQRSISLIGVMAITLGVSTYVLNHVHQGWYNYYVFELPRHHQEYSILKRRIATFWLEDLFAPLSIACTLSLFYLITQTVSRRETKTLFYLLLTLGMIGSAWLARLNSGGYNNVLFPAYAVLSILFGLGVHTLSKLVRMGSLHERKLMEICVYLMCMMQFVILIYNPFHQVPTAKDRIAGRKFVRTLAQFAGEVLVLSHGHLPSLAGKESYAQKGAIYDIMRGGESQIRTDLITEIKEAIREKRFDAIIVDENPFDIWFPWFKESVEEYYEKERLVFDNKEVFWPVTGHRTRPGLIFVPKRRTTSEQE